MTELYSHVNIYLDYFPERLKYAKLGNQSVLHFEYQCQKLLRLYHNTYVLLLYIDLSTKSYRGLWFNRTHLPLFQKMSVKIYTIFFLSLELYNFKINYLKDKIRHGMWVDILLNNLASSPLQLELYFWHRKSKYYEKEVKFCPEIFECNVFVRSNNFNNRFDLAAYMFGITNVLISEYVQKIKWVDT